MNNVNNIIDLQPRIKLVDGYLTLRAIYSVLVTPLIVYLFKVQAIKVFDIDIDLSKAIEHSGLLTTLSTVFLSIIFFLHLTRYIQSCINFYCSDLFHYRTKVQSLKEKIDGQRVLHERGVENTYDKLMEIFKKAKTKRIFSIVTEETVFHINMILIAGLYVVSLFCVPLIIHKPNY